MEMTTDCISKFTDEYRWLSNFWPIEVVMDGETYPSVEHAYQAAKTLPEHREQFKSCTAGQAKRLGRRVPMRPEWEDIKIAVMRDLIQQKFTFGSNLSESLLRTSPMALVEGNHWGDTFWGVCDGVGQNHLGNLLMEQRDFLRKILVYEVSKLNAKNGLSLAGCDTLTGMGYMKHHGDGDYRWVIDKLEHASVWLLRVIYNHRDREV